MSSILKALKKLEREKVARKFDALNIDAEILRSDDSTRFPLVMVSLAVVLVFLCGSTATYLYMKHAVTSPSPPPGNKTADSSATATAVIDSLSQTGTTPTVSSQPGSVLPDHTPGRLKTRQPPSRNSEPMHTTARPVQPKTSAEKKQLTATREQVTSAALPPTTAFTTPLLRVNGIAFQDGGADRMAVVNGIPVSNGSVIEGVRIEDILKDRVRFNYGSERFEVGLGKSNR